MSTSATSLVFDLFGNDVSASKALKNVGKEAESASGGMSSAFKKTASAVTAAGLVAVAASIHMAADFQQQMTRLVSAAGESESNLKMVSAGVLQVARDTGVSTNELATSMYQVESAGFHGANGLTVLKAAAQGAQVEGANATSVANALTTVLDDMHKPASDAANVMSQLVVAVGQGKMTMDDLTGSIHSVLPNATALGMSLAQVAGDLAEMTSQGISADQAAQNMNHTIVKLAAPTAAMTKSMSMYGLTSSDVAKNLGKNGLSGTLDILSKAILSKMGPAGTTLLNAFNTSKVAANDLNIMMKKLPAGLQASAKLFVAGKEGLKDFTSDVKSFGGPASAMGMQFIALYKSQMGFNTALTSGGPAAQTFTAAMKGMLGDQTGLQVALHLTGKASADTSSKIALIGAATADGSGNVKDFTMKSKNLNIEVAKMKEDVATAAITIGTKLIPAVSSSVEWVTKHSTVVEEAVIGLVALAATVKIVEFAIRAVSAAQALWTGITKVASAAQAAMQTVFGTTAAQAQASALVQAQAAVSVAEAEAAKATAVAEASVEIAASLEGTDSVLAGEATAAAQAAIEFSAAMDAQVLAAQGAAAEIATAMAAAVTSEEEVGAAASTAFGPVGIALTAVVGIGALAGHALGLFGSAAAAQIKPTEDFTNAILNDNDALGTNTRALVENKLEKDGAYDAALKLGIGQKTLTDAMMGNKDALATVGSAMAAYDGASISSYGMTNAQADAQYKLRQAALSLKGSIGDVTTTLAVNQTAANNLLAANGELGGSFTGSANAAEHASGAAAKTAGNVDVLGGKVSAATTEAQNLATALSGLANLHPKPTVAVGGLASASTALTALQHQLDALHGRTLQVGVTGVSLNNLQKIGAFASGGIARGPGTGTSDTAGVYALSDGEAVIPAKAVSANLGLVHSLINAGRGRASGTVVGTVGGTIYTTDTGYLNALSRATSALGKQIAAFVQAVFKSTSTADELQSAVTALMDAAKKAGVSSANLAEAVKLEGKMHADATKRDSLQAQLGTPSTSGTTAYDRLTTAMDAFNSEASTVAQAVKSGSGFNLTGEATNSQLGYNYAGPVAVQSTLLDMNSAIGQATSFSNNIAALAKKLGNSSAAQEIIQQLAEAGPSSGGAETSALVGASAAQLQQLLAGQSKLDAVAAATGKTAANAIDGKQLKAAEDQVSILKSGIAQLTSHIDGIGKQVASALGSRIGKNAAGTDHWGGGLTWVGENGKELLNLPAGSKIMSHPASMRAVANAMGRGPAMSGAGVGGGPGVNHYYSVSVKGGIGDPKQTAKAIATELSRLKGNGDYPSNL